MAVEGRGRWSCRCDCGTERQVWSNNLQSGKSQSCGCAQDHRESRLRHGLSHSPEWRTYYNMLSRCYRTSSRDYPKYGGRGIEVCESWRSSFDAFVADMGLRPPGHTIDRIDNDGPYSPENCQWATRETQNSNTRRNVYVDYQGERMTTAELSRRTGIDRRTLQQRYRKGDRAERLVRPVA